MKYNKNIIIRKIKFPLIIKNISLLLRKRWRVILHTVVGCCAKKCDHEENSTSDSAVCQKIILKGYC